MMAIFPRGPGLAGTRMSPLFVGVKLFSVILLFTNFVLLSLQCCDTVGWATERASGLWKADVGLLMVM